MKYLSPPSPEVRAVLKMCGGAVALMAIVGVLSLLSRFFTVEQIMTGASAVLLALTVYTIYRILVDQERYRDARGQ